MTQEENKYDEVKYVGFTQRLNAFAIDSFILLPIFYILFPDAFALHFPPEVSGLINDLKLGVISTDEFYSEFFIILLKQNSLSNNTGSVVQFIVAGIFVVLFWVYRSATPGKIILSMKIVDSKTLGKPTNIQLVVRYLAYFISSLPLFLGFLWVIFDKKKQGWHDKIAGTAVIYTKIESEEEAKKRKFRRQTYMAIVIVIIFLLYFSLK